MKRKETKIFLYILPTNRLEKINKAMKETETLAKIHTIEAS